MPTPETPALKDAIKTLSRGYARLGYDLGLLLAEEHEMIKADGVSLPPAWLVEGAEPRGVVLERGGGKVGILIVPESRDDGPISREAQQMVMDKASELKGKVQILIGISTWGIKKERAFLEGTPPVFDILFGAGPGWGFSGQPMAGNRTLWARASTKGMAVNMVEIPGWPASATDKDSTVARIARAEMISLGDAIPDDEELRKTINP